MAAIATLTIESIAAGGDGVGRRDGLAVFVPRTAPGDVVDVAVDLRGRFGRGRVERVAQPSELRVTPACEHYTRDACGGCQLQHLAYDAQRQAKQGIIRDAITRIAKRPLEVPPVHASPAQWRYRTKLTLGLETRDGRWIAGLHRYDDPARIFELHDCPITEERIVATWREIVSAGELLPRARTLRGAVRLVEDGAVLTLEGSAQWRTAQAFGQRCPSLVAIWWTGLDGRRRLVLDKRHAPAPDASFVQINPTVASMLHERVVSAVLRHEPKTVIDAYAGAGATAVVLAAAGVAVTAIEVDPDAARWVGAHMPAGSRSLVGRVEDRLAEALPADVVVLNPPRTGIDERVARALEMSHTRPRAVVYVSCDPATLARDLTRLPSFRITSLVGFDMFPQTAHVETLCELAPEAA